MNVPKDEHDASESLLWAETKPEKSADIIKQINSRNAKIIAVGLVIGFILYHGIVHLQYGNDSCKWLLSDGKYKGDMEWQPYGCMMHQYTQLDTRRCIRYLAFWGRHNHFVFIGDGRILDIYTAFVEHLAGDSRHSPAAAASAPSKDGRGAEPDPKPAPVYQNYSFSDMQLRVTVDFVWSPFVSEVMVRSFRNWRDQLEPPNLIVAGSGIWGIRKTNGSTKGIKDYVFNLTKLVQPMEELSSKKIRILWVLQEPVNEEKLPKNWAGVTNHAIDQYNWAAREVLWSSKAEIWASSRSLSWKLVWESQDGGLHLPRKSLRHHTQILTNLHCNDHMAFLDGTCCSSPEHRTPLQGLSFALLAICGVIGGFLMFRQYKNRGRRIETPSAYQVLIVSLAKLFAIMAYFYLCDRTNFFMKENKYYSSVSFWLPLSYLFALGLFFTEDSRYTRVLHRDQTEETKGWMQLVLMMYHYTGASSSLHVRNHVQIINSAYLFLTGYGHFYYLWQRNDAGIVRFFQVIFRLNFLPVLLCLCMNRPYQFYPFAPLISFWFLLLYLTMVLPPRVSATSVEVNPLHYLYFVLKMVGLFTAIVVLYMSEVFFDKVFVTRPWKALFVTTDDDIHDWWIRWKLNRYSMCFGMIFGLALVTAQKFNLIDDSNHSNLFSGRIALGTTLLSMAGLGAASAYALLCPNSLQCDEVHSYTVFVPLLCYIVLRNISGVLRTRYSSLFAWFGRLSQELCYCQVHIWLAADSHGVLVFVPGYPVLNALITSFIFVCAAHEVNKVTAILLPYAVPSDWRLVIRNALVFFLILVPIGIHDGMF